MSKRLLVDTLKFDPKQILVEGQDGKKRMHVEGFVSVADETTGNGRRYGRPIWEKHIGDKQSAFMKRLAEKKVLGLLEHPENEPSLEKASHLWEEARFLPSGQVSAKALILETPNGNILKELFQVGVPVGVSSRGEGSTVLADDGVTEDVQDDYELETWDFVHTPAIESARAEPVKESLKKKGRKEQENMEDALQKAKDTIAEAEKNPLSALGLPELAALHVKVVEAMTPLARLAEAEAAELRGRLAGIGSQVSRAITERSKTASDRVTEKFNEEYPTGLAAITGLVEELVARTSQLEADLKKAKEGKDESKELSEAKTELEETKKRLASAMRAGDELVKRTNKILRKQQQVEKKYAIAVNMFDRVMEAVRAKGLHRQVELLVGKIPSLRHVKEELLRSTTAKELRERADKFSKLIKAEEPEKTESKSKPKTRTEASREPLPPTKVKKAKRVTEDGGSGGKPSTLFTRMTQRGL